MHESILFLYASMASISLSVALFIIIKNPNKNAKNRTTNARTNADCESRKSKVE